MNYKYLIHYLVELGIILLDGLKHVRDEEETNCGAQESVVDTVDATDIRASNLRVMIVNSEWSAEILKNTGETILPWLRDKVTGLADDEAYRLHALIMKSQGKEEWYNPINEGL